MTALMLLAVACSSADPVEQLVAESEAAKAACEAGDADACMVTGVYAGYFQSGTNGKIKFPPDHTRVAVLSEAACTGGSELACTIFAGALRKGQGTTQDPARAATLYEQGCDKKRAADCGLLAQMLAEGEGVEKDPVRAAQLAEQACAWGARFACTDAAPAP